MKAISRRLDAGLTPSRSRSNECAGPRTNTNAAGNQVPSPPHTCHVGVALRRLAGNVVGRLEQVPVVFPGDGGEARTDSHNRLRAALEDSGWKPE
jgi:hypothetical protein